MTATASHTKCESQCIYYSRFHVKKAESRKYQKQVVVAFYGITAHKDNTAIPAQLHIFKDHHPLQTFHIPNFIVILENAKISMTPPQSPSQGEQPGHKAAYCSFSITTSEGTLYEFEKEDGEECQTWINLLQFLSHFPYSRIPEEPKCDPILHNKDLDASLYKADFVWSVYILPEEVGSRCHITGLNILALRRTVTDPAHKGEIELYSPEDCHNPVITCTHNMIRLVGKMRVFVYVEFGRRCKGGPGLLWMYCGNNEETAAWMKDILFEFLLHQQVLPGLLPPPTPQRLEPSPLPLPQQLVPSPPSSACSTRSEDQHTSPSPPPLPPRLEDPPKQYHYYHTLVPTPKPSTLNTLV